MKAIGVLFLSALALVIVNGGRCAESLEPAGSAGPIEAEITIARVSESTWQVDYRFDRPVDGVEFGPAVGRYRADGWEVVTPGLRLIHGDGAERLVSTGGPFDHVWLEVSFYSAFPPDNYVPIARFSDGGAALVLGFFGGDAITAAGTTEMRERYRLRGRDGEFVFAPAGVDRGERVFAYFGGQHAMEAGRARLIVDPAAPAWLVRLLRQTLAEVTPVYETRLGRRLDAPPLVLIAAGEIDSIDGYSTKGGAINGQVMATLRGRSLAEESNELRHTFSRLMAHELAHLWQEGDADSRFNEDEPWIHEGGAESLAVAALAESGLWSAEEAGSDTRDASRRCVEETGGESVEKAVADGRYGAVYPCGQALFAARGTDVFAVWAALNRAAESRGTIYSGELLEEVVSELIQERVP